MKTGVFFILTLFLFLMNGTVVFSQESVRAKIVANVANNLIDAKAVAQNNDSNVKDNYSYSLFSFKKGAHGNSAKNSQSGKFSLQPGEEKTLSTLKVNIQKEDECKIILFIRKDEAIISKDSITIYAADNKKK